MELLQEIEAGQERDESALIDDGVQIDGETFHLGLATCRRRPLAGRLVRPLVVAFSRPGLASLGLVVVLAGLPLSALERAGATELLAPIRLQRLRLVVVALISARRYLVVAAAAWGLLHVLLVGRRPGPVEQRTERDVWQLAIVERERADLVYIETCVPLLLSDEFEVVACALRLVIDQRAGQNEWRERWVGGGEATS